MTAITITAEQRDALYEQLMIRLSGIDDVYISYRQGDFEATERFGREFADNLLLVLDDLKLGDGTGEDVELRTPPDVLRRVMRRVVKAAEAEAETEAEARAEAETYRKQNRLVQETCRSVLARLEVG